MIERLKDFLYDISDIVVSLLIIAAIFFSVSWKISDTLSYNLEEDLNNTSAITENEVSTETETLESSESDSETVINIIPDDTADANAANETPETDSPAETPVDNSGQSENSPQLTLVTFTVPSGASGYSIGQALADDGYIDNAQTFVSRLVERELDRKLFAGDFELSKNDDLDTIINVLTGQGR